MPLLLQVECLKLLCKNGIAVVCSKTCCFSAIKLCSFLFAKLLNKDFVGCKMLPVTLVQFRCIE